MELALTARLRALITEHRSNVIEFANIGFSVQLVLHVRTNDSSCTFRSQRHAAVSLIEKGVHFFFHYVCCLTNTAFEKGRHLEYRCANLPVIKAPAQISCLLFNELPPLHNTGQQILSTCWFLKAHGLSSTLLS
ncbi:hypothetical protein D3C86_1581970 [compost metagenome]